MQLPPHELPKFIGQCLEQGFKQAEIASSVGVSEAYISQIIAATPALQQLTTAGDAAFDDIDAAYLRIEKKALDALERGLNMVEDPMKLLRIAATINATKRRSSVGKGVLEAVGTGAAHGTVVQLTLPTTIAQQFVFNSNNQAVALAEGGAQVKQLVTASIAQLDTLAESEQASGQSHSEQRLASEM